MKRLLLLKPGLASMRARYGDYESWFAHGFGGLAEVTKVELHAGEPVPAFDGFDGVVMSGSPRSVMEEADWMVRAADALLDAGARGLPVLGVCFGHQLLAWRLGARVVQNPKGRELGTQGVELTAAGQVDPLFAGVPPSAAFQLTHDDVVDAVPAGGVLLATNAHCAVQAFAHGAKLRGVQFHVEMDAATIRDAIRASGHPDAARLDEAAHDTPHGFRVLQNFVTRFC